jgi:hypothetical protein
MIFLRLIQELQLPALFFLPEAQETRRRLLKYMIFLS